MTVGKSLHNHFSGPHQKVTWPWEIGHVTCLHNHMTQPYEQVTWPWHKSPERTPPTAPEVLPMDFMSKPFPLFLHHFLSLFPCILRKNWLPQLFFWCCVATVRLIYNLRSLGQKKVSRIPRRRTFTIAHRRPGLKRDSKICIGTTLSWWLVVSLVGS